MLSRRLPTSLIIQLNAQKNESVLTEGAYSARSPQFLEFEGRASDAVGAIKVLLDDVGLALEEAEDRQPLSARVVTALLEAGHPMDLVHQWDRVMRGGARRFRYDAQAAVTELQSYAVEGVPPFAASEFIAAWWWVWTPKDAGRIHSAGLSAEHVRDYREWSATDRWYQWDFDVIEWALSGVPAERVLLYSGRCSVDEARRWELIAEEHDIIARDLDAIVEAGIGVDDFVENQTPACEVA